MLEIFLDHHATYVARDDKGNMLQPRDGKNRRIIARDDCI